MRLIAVAFLGMGLASAAWGGECAIGNDAPPVSVGTIDLEFPEHTGQPDQIYPISPWIEADFHDALSACDTSRPSSAQVVPTVNPGHFRGTYTEGGRNYFVFGSPLYLPPGVGIVFEYTHINSSDFIPIDFQKEMRLAILDPSPASLSFKARARLVVFGKFEPGIYPVSFGLLRYREFEPGGKGYTSANFRLSGMLKFVSKTCVLTSDAAPTIDLDPVKLGDFGGVGSHAVSEAFGLMEARQLQVARSAIRHELIDGVTPYHGAYGLSIQQRKPRSKGHVYGVEL